jgi:hypothetical protein
MGLDDPDTLYFHSYLRDDAEYVVTGRRGSTADLSFADLAAALPYIGQALMTPAEYAARIAARQAAVAARMLG